MCPVYRSPAKNNSPISSEMGKILILKTSADRRQSGALHPVQGTAADRSIFWTELPKQSPLQSTSYRRRASFDSPNTAQRLIRPTRITGKLECARECSAATLEKVVRSEILDAMCSSGDQLPSVDLSDRTSLHEIGRGRFLSLPWERDPKWVIRSVGVMCAFTAIAVGCGAVRKPQGRRHD